MKYGLSEKQLNEIISILKQYKEIEEAVVFGSRALGTFKEASDIDIALKGSEVTPVLAAKLKTYFEEETYSPFFMDFVAYSGITNEELKKHIETKGVTLFNSDKTTTGSGNGKNFGMSEWKLYSLGDVCHIFDGPHATPTKQSTGKIFLGISSLDYSGRIDESAFEYISDNDFSKWTRRVIPGENDIVFSYETKLGAAARIPSGLECCLGRRMGLLRTKLGHDPRFIFYAYLAPEFQSVIFERTYHGSTVDRIPLKEMPSFPILLPPLPEQKAIASVLSSLDDKIDLLHRQNKTLESMAETLFRQWFVEEAEQEKCTLDEIIDFNPRTSLQKGTMAPYLEMSNVSTSTFHPEAWYPRKFTSGTKFKNGDSLLARITPCLENGKTCYVTFIPENGIGWGSTEYIVLRTKEQLHPFFTYCLVTNNDFHDYAEICMEGSSGRQRVNLDHLKKYEINKPKEVSISAFNGFAASIEPRLIHNYSQIDSLKSLRDTLLPKLMSGEARVDYDQ